jgi:hypothetical protein
VKDIAAAIPGTPDIKQRLLFDPGMEGVWRALRERPVTQETVNGLPEYQLLATWDIPVQGISPQDQACAAMFAYVAIEFPNGPVAWTMAEARELADQWDSAAKLCRWIACDPMFDRNFAATAAAMVDGLVPHEKSLRKTGRLVDLGQRDEPFILEGSSPKSASKRRRGDHHDNKIRGQVRALAYAMHEIYGAYLRAPLAAIATIVLDTTIPPKSVDNWCKNLVYPPRVAKMTKRISLDRLTAHIVVGDDDLKES